MEIKLLAAGDDVLGKLIQACAVGMISLRTWEGPPLAAMRGTCGISGRSTSRKKGCSWAGISQPSGEPRSNDSEYAAPTVWAAESAPEELQTNHTFSPMSF